MLEQSTNSSSSVYVLAGMGGLSIDETPCVSASRSSARYVMTERMLVRDGVNGLLFRDGDLQDLTSKILYLFHHPDKRRSMGIKSTQIIRNGSLVHTVLKGYLHAFDFVMNQGRRRITGIRSGSDAMICHRITTEAGIIPKLGRIARQQILPENCCPMHPGVSGNVDQNLLRKGSQ